MMTITIIINDVFVDAPDQSVNYLNLLGIGSLSANCLGFQSQ